MTLWNADIWPHTWRMRRLSKSRIRWVQSALSTLSTKGKTNFCRAQCWWILVAFQFLLSLIFRKRMFSYDERKWPVAKIIIWIRHFGGRRYGVNFDRRDSEITAHTSKGHVSFIRSFDHSPFIRWSCDWLCFLIYFDGVLNFKVVRSVSTKW